MVNTVKDKVTARTEYNFVPGYIMDAKYEVREEERKQAKAELLKSKKETAKNLKSMNLSNKQISEATGLSISEVELL